MDGLCAMVGRYHSDTATRVIKRAPLTSARQEPAVTQTAARPPAGGSTFRLALRIMPLRRPPSGELAAAPPPTATSALATAGVTTIGTAPHRTHMCMYMQLCHCGVGAQAIHTARAIQPQPVNQRS